MHHIVEDASDEWLFRKRIERRLKLKMYGSMRTDWAKHLAAVRKDETATADDIAAMERLFECATAELGRIRRDKTAEQEDLACEKSRERQRRWCISLGHLDPDESPTATDRMIAARMRDTVASSNAPPRAFAQSQLPARSRQSAKRPS